VRGKRKKIGTKAMITRYREKEKKRKFKRKAIRK